MADARDLFHAAAGPPSPAGPNVEAITRRGRALRRRRQLLLGASGAVAIVVLASVVALVGTSRDAVVEQPATATVTPRVDPSRPSTPVPNAGTTTLTVYLLAAATDGCSRLQPVQRTVPALSINNDVRAPVALRQLFAGPTARERTRGLRSVIRDTRLQSVRVLNGLVFPRPDRRSARRHRALRPLRRRLVPGPDRADAAAVRRTLAAVLRPEREPCRLLRADGQDLPAAPS